MLPVISNFLSRILPAKPIEASNAVVPIRAPLQALGINDFLNLDIPPREMLLDPILPERSLAMLYAPRGLGKSWLALSIGVTIASVTRTCSARRSGRDADHHAAAATRIGTATFQNAIPARPE